MQHSSTPWWTTEDYAIDAGVPPQFDHDWAGPKGIALVKAWPDGRTDRGWGLNPPKGEKDGFMPRYMRGEFNDRRVLYGYDRGRWSFAFIMRSLKLVAIDIDGKNGGLEHAKRLVLPPTMAEISKSGNGYHLLYLVDEEWDDTLGFATLGDRIGFEQGVDFRSTGCVYHHPQQRWNRRLPTQLPTHLFELIKNREQKVAANHARIVSVLANNDDMEVLMLQDEILSRLARDIPQGKRNNTLFAIGCEMQAAAVPDWQNHIADRAVQIGLDLLEAEKLVANIDRYALSAATP